jgi:hypothetical protein
VSGLLLDQLCAGFDRYPLIDTTASISGERRCSSCSCVVVAIIEDEGHWVWDRESVTVAFFLVVGTVSVVDGVWIRVLSEVEGECSSERCGS